MLFTLHNLITFWLLYLESLLVFPFSSFPVIASTIICIETVSDLLYTCQKGLKHPSLTFFFCQPPIYHRKRWKKNVLAGPNKYQYIHTVVNIHTNMYASHSRSIRTKATSMGTVQPERIATNRIPRTQIAYQKNSNRKRRDITKTCNEKIIKLPHFIDIHNQY